MRGRRHLVPAEDANRRAIQRDCDIGRRFEIGNRFCSRGRVRMIHIFGIGHKTGDDQPAVGSAPSNGLERCLGCAEVDATAIISGADDLDAVQPELGDEADRLND